MAKNKFLPIITLTICAIIGFLYWQLIYIPIQSEISSMQAETRRLQAINAELEALQARYGDLAEFVALNDERLATAREYLPPEMRDEEFTAELYRLADYRDILVSSVQIGEITGDELQKLPVKIRLETDFVTLLNFIREVVDGERLAHLESFNIENDGKSNILNCELEFIIYAANVANF